MHLPSLSRAPAALVASEGFLPISACMASILWTIVTRAGHLLPIHGCASLPSSSSLAPVQWSHLVPPGGGTHLLPTDGSHQWSVRARLPTNQHLNSFSLIHPNILILFSKLFIKLSLSGEPWALDEKKRRED